jgi:hypothetical protein
MTRQVKPMAWMAAAMRSTKARMGRGTGRDEAEDAGFGRAARPLAGAVDHQPRQFDHQVRLGPGGLEEGFARQGQDFGVAQGHDVGGVRRPRQHGHFTDRLAGTHDAEQMDGLIRFAVEDAQTARTDQIQGV